MDDMFQEDNISEKTGPARKPDLSPEACSALELGRLLTEHRGGDVVVMDMRNLNFWTDFFVIATVNSGSHLQGLERHIKEFSREKGIDIRGKSRRPGADDEWRLIDLNTIVVHLMTAKCRSFYELERLWDSAELLYRQEPELGKKTGPTIQFHESTTSP
jgi:ribosome-associated protein